MVDVVRIKLALVRCPVLVVLVGVLVLAANAAATMLRWSPAVRIDPVSLRGLACPSTSLCVAVDSAGRVVVSTRPAGGPARWRPIDPLGGVRIAMTDISCPSTRLCAAVDSAGNVITSSNPANLRSWSVAHVDGSTSPNGGALLTGISCPSKGFCVAVDAAGNALTSTNPTAGTRAWTLHRVDSGVNYECYHYNETGPSCVPGIVAVSCWSNTHCIAIDWAGGILSTTDPTGAGSWGGGEQPASESYSALACPSGRFCLLAMLYLGQVFRLHDGALTPSMNLEANGTIEGVWCPRRALCFATGSSNQSPNPPTNVFQSRDPGATKPHWQRVLTTPTAISAISCPSATMCVAAEEDGTVLVRRPADSGHR